MYTYDFQIAGLLIRFNGPFALHDFFELTAFAVAHTPDRAPDVLYTLELLPDNWNIQGQLLAQSSHSAVYECENELHRYFHWSIYSQDRFVLVRSEKGQSRKYHICLQKDFLHRLLPQLRLPAFMAPEEFLLESGAFLLHAAVIDWNGIGILFTGPSGIGKSTQAQLWAQLEGAEILNGDRAIIRYQNGKFTAWGSPYAGTSGIYKKRGVPIGAIVALSQAETNHLSPLTGLPAFRQILQEATTAPWDPAFMSQLTDLLLTLTEQIPIWHLSCTPTPEAAQTLKDTLTK